MQNTYSWTKNLGLIVLALIALMYALPNLYGEAASIQVSATSKASAGMASLLQTMKSALTNANIPYTRMSMDERNVDVQFATTDIQLHARDVIKQQLGPDYTVVLNLMPATPSWLSAFGALPMKQGLDLRGGVHFLLEVDVHGVIERRYVALSQLLRDQLVAEKIAMSSAHAEKDQGIDLVFAQMPDLLRAKAFLTQHDGGILDCTDAPEPLTLRLTLTESEVLQIKRNTMEQTLSILRKRVNELGVGEAVVQQQGLNRVAVDLPGIQDATRARHILGGTATLEFYLVDSEHDPMEAKTSGVVPEGSKLYDMEGYPILLKRDLVLSGDSISSAMSSFDQQTASLAVSVQLGGGGEAQFTRVTQDNVGRRMAIVYAESKTVSKVEGEKGAQYVTHHEERVISAPRIQSALGSHFQITGLTDSEEAKNLALLLRAGSLPAVIYPVEERTVGPSLGQENIHRGVVSLAVGMALILLLMGMYYRLFGLIANAALVLNLIFLTALLSVLGATLTLPGIAGIVLTVGMAVDANVLIYERIREELRAGSGVQSAIFSGYERAFATILDANITTFIVAVVLFSIGTGPVRGFAVTLSLGLITSMLTAITYTRAMVNLLYGNRVVKKLSIGI